MTDERADITTLSVQVQNSVSDTRTVTYIKATDITQLTSSSAVYFCQEVEAGKFEIYFGDGIVSKALVDGNIVTMKYVVTNKTEANGVASFTSPSSIAGETAISVQTLASATGGAEPESINSIKLKAPLDYASQGRAVTVEDYKVFVKRLFPNTQSVSVWGGENGSYDQSTGVSSTPQYGKVFISIKSTTGNTLTSVQKSNLVSSLSPYKVASITPVIVDAEVSYIILNVTIQYDKNATTSSPSELEAKVNTTLSNYNTSDLLTFNNPFRHSVVTSKIDSSDPSILNSTATVTLAKYFTPTINSQRSYTINFNNKLYNPHPAHNVDQGGIVSSTGFYIDSDSVYTEQDTTSKEYFLDDDGDGNLRLFSFSALARIYNVNRVGTVDYVNGIVTIFPINISSVSNVDGLTSKQIRITAIPDSYDIIPVRNQILELDLVNTRISASVDATASTGVGYTTSTDTAGNTRTIVTTASSTASSSAY